jgi:peroxiredoxin
MKTLPFLLLGIASVAIAAPLLGQGKASIGVVTPSWTLKDSNGQSFNIESYRGKYVVLEWTNPECPYVRRHYDTGNMQNAQEKARQMGAVWLTVDSAVPGMTGYFSPSEANSYRKEMKVKSNATLIDSQGTVGHIYGAKATPQVVVVDPKGVVIYNGAIDDGATPDEQDNPASHTNYVLAALKESMAGKPVAVASTRPYGCGIKYAH